MTQLEKLWQYQLADVKADQMERDMKRSPKRQRLLKLRDQLKAHQETIQKLEQALLNMLDRLEVLKVAIANSEDQLRQLQTQINDSPANDSAQVARFVEDSQRIMRDLVDFDQEIVDIRRVANDHDRRIRDMKLRAFKQKEEFDALREEYDAWYKEKSVTLDALKAAAEAEKGGLDAELLDKYMHVKQHATPPMARLENGQCSGCNMGFPSSVAYDIKQGKLVECETCGRLVIA